MRGEGVLHASTTSAVLLVKRLVVRQPLPTKMKEKGGGGGGGGGRARSVGQGFRLRHVEHVLLGLSICMLPDIPADPCQHCHCCLLAQRAAHQRSPAHLGQIAAILLCIGIGLLRWGSLLLILVLLVQLGFHFLFKLL